MTMNNKQALKTLKYVSLTLILLSSGAQGSTWAESEDSSNDSESDIGEKRVLRPVDPRKLQHAHEIGREMEEKYHHKHAAPSRRSRNEKGLLDHAKELYDITPKLQSKKLAEEKKTEEELESIEKGAIETLFGLISFTIKHSAEESKGHKQTYENMIRRPTEEFNARKKKKGVIEKLFG
ncbi:MAG: hypothetical protein IBJ00_02305 [Alphaproteobacteria bacterium]|nr:hypothetical protein [Alphaproteobacteria bacterium]